jgi:hypothetical protein|tara:strand:+ start:14660 stop:15349 length:690 start_codon:yes stop_codon:yes gene_type:complete
MATFLEICQKVARESGTISGALPTAVTGQTGRLLKIVNWVADAWDEIQNDQSTWLWMRKEFSDVTVADTFKYSASDWSLTNFSRWVIDPLSVTMYLTATGVSDEGELKFITWEEWRIKYGRGTQDSGRPIEYTITPAEEFAVGPKPDAVYTINGEYFEDNETLAADGDTPNCPARFHNVIVWKALMKLAGSDEGGEQSKNFEALYKPLRFALERDQLPKISIASTATLA